MLTEVGAILYSDGTERNSSTFATHRRTPYIFLPKDAVIDITGMANITANAMLAVYTINKVYSQANSVKGSGGSYKINTRFTMPFNGYVRFATTDVYAATAVIKNITALKQINMLVLGNSFSQDAFAYVPKIFEELNTDYVLNLVIGYIGSSDLSDHISAITNNTAYDFVDIWDSPSSAWVRYAKGGATEKTASQLLALKHWDIIYVQASGSIVSDEMVMTNAVAPAKALLRLLISQLEYGFVYCTGQWLANQDAIEKMADAIDLIDSRVGFNDIIPIGTGIANARSNATLAVLGEAGNMLYDSTHQQSGLPTVISAYVIVQYILNMFGIMNASIYQSTWMPTTENCIEINAYKDGGMTTPYPMTHGDSVGVTDAYMLAAKQIASIAVRNPYVISDCSQILV